MQVTLEVPEDLARLLEKDADSLSRAALEALALEGVRSGRLTAVQARRLLGIRSRYEMDGFLKAQVFSWKLPPRTVVGIQTPRLAVSSGPPTASVGYLP